MSTEFKALVAECLSKENHLSAGELEQVKAMESCCTDSYLPTKGQIEYLKELANPKIKLEVKFEEEKPKNLSKKFFKNES